MTKESNKELEELIYIISHDLNAPFRHIKEFTGILMQNLNDDGRLNEREKTYADYISESVEEVQSMLAGLLEYSRLSTRPECKTNFNFKHLIEEATKEYKEYISISCADDIEIFASRKQIMLLVSKLIDNSVKFQAEGAVPKINIKVEKNKKHLTLSIKDNGIGGINDCHKDEIFRIFKKLNHKEAFNGDGLGLAICKKITELHQGKIWLDNSDSNGSTFKVRL